MASYANGRFPLSMFEHLGGNIYLPAATAGRWRGFRDDVRSETGVTLRITGNIDGLGGWNGYRPLDPQKEYKKHYGPKAAEPGKSSHGGVYRGSDFFAFDVANSGDIPWSTFVRLAKKWGLMTDFVTPTERWHVGDPNPWSMPAASGSNQSEEDDMFTDQDRANQVSIMLALGASGLTPENEPTIRTAIKMLQAIDGQVNGLPDALKAIMGQVNGAPEVLAEIRASVGVSDIQVKTIADAVAKQIGTPSVQLDYAAIAKAVNDDAAKRLAA